MSRIFDALQRSEAERTGTGLSVPVSVTELLERAELEEVSKRRPQSAAAPRTGTQLSEEHGSALATGVLSDESQNATEASNQAEIFKEFRTVAVSTSPNQRLVAFDDHDSPGAEAFRLLGVRLKDIRRERSIKRLLL